MDDTRPQDIHFAWEDIMEFKSITASKRTRRSAQSLSISDFRHQPKDDMFDEDDEIEFPTYDDGGNHRRPLDLVSPMAPMSASPPEIPQPPEPELVEKAEDDVALLSEPSRHVDYLTHEWCEEDIWATWKYLRTTRKRVSNRERLENASWRLWMKQRYHLRTTAPESINWMKDRDVTWLYGPYQSGSSIDQVCLDNSAAGVMRRSGPYYEKVKSILKKPTLSQVLLRRSLSTTINATRLADVDMPSPSIFSPQRPIRSPHKSNTFGPGLSLPAFDRCSSPSTKSVRFHDEVEQFVAVVSPLGDELVEDNVFERSFEASEDEEERLFITENNALHTPTTEEVSRDFQSTLHLGSDSQFEDTDSGMESDTEAESGYDSEDSDKIADSGYFGNRMDTDTSTKADLARSVLAPAQEELVDRVMNEFWKLFNQEWDSNITSCTDGSSSSPTESSSSPNRSTSSSSKQPQRKRQRVVDDSESPEENQEKKRQPKKLPPNQDSDEITKFACPFRKNDARVYNIYNYRLDAHLTVASSEICEVQVGSPPAGITPAIERKLRSRKKSHPNQTDEERWKDIYRLLFPNIEVPSPYFDGVQEDVPSSPDTRELSNYEEYIRRELPRLVRSNIEEVVRRETQPLEAALIGSLVGIIQDCQDRVFRAYRETQGMETDDDNQPQTGYGESPMHWTSGNAGGNGLSYPAWQNVDNAEDEADWWMNI
ncbi:putative resistance to glucose repression protein 1 [Halenospora varia]|nr:putative resistance to glucose repression protein 1 [Halenospora varia]